MKSYPSIPRSSPKNCREFEAHVFDKIDGSNLRFEWSKKRGWYKSGTRKRLFDESDPVFGQTIAGFQAALADPIEEVAQQQGWERVIAFCEGAGEHSFAGKHKQGEQMFVHLIDVAPYKRGILPTDEFLDLFHHIQWRPMFLGIHEWNADFITRIREGRLVGVTFEGVVGKAEIDKKIIMEKAKTHAWIDKVLDRYGDKGKAIVES